MILRLLGRDKMDEYNTSSWAVNAVVDGVNDGILAGTDVNYMAPATREQTIQYIFNALSANYVTFSRDSQSYSPRILIRPDVDPGTYMTIQNAIYPELKYTEGGKDDYGRPTAQWAYKDELIRDDSVAPALRFTGPVTERQVYTGLRLTAPAIGATAATSYIDGSDNDSPQNIRRDDELMVTGTGGGTVTEVFVDKGNITIIIMSVWLARVDGEIEADEDKEIARKIELNVFMGDDDEEDYTFETDDFEEDDILLVTIANDEIQSAVSAPVVTNVSISTFTNGESVTAGGTTYEYSKNNVFGIPIFSGGADSINGKYNEAPGGWDTTFTFYLDGQGNILGNVIYEAAAVALNFIYVEEAIVTVGATGASSSAKVKVFYLDGESEELNIQVLTATATVPGSTTTYEGGKTVGVNAGDRYVRIADTSGAFKYYYVGGRANTDGMILPDAGGASAEFDRRANLADVLMDVLNKGLVSYKEVNGSVELSLQVVQGDAKAELYKSPPPSPTPTPEPVVFQFVSRRASVLAAGGFTPGNANATTTLVSVSEDGDVETYAGFANFPAGPDGWKHTASNAAPVVVASKGGTITNILVIGASWELPAEPDGFAVYTGDSRLVPAGTEYRLFVSGTLRWVLMDAPPTVAKTVVYPFFFSTATNKGSLESGLVNVYKVVSVDIASGFFMYDFGSTREQQLLASNAVVYNVTHANTANWSTGTASALRADQYVIVADEGDDGAKVIFIVPEPS